MFNNEEESIKELEPKPEPVAVQRDEEPEDFFRSVININETNINAIIEDDSLYSKTELISISLPTTFDAETGTVDAKIIDAVIQLVKRKNSDAFIVINSLVPEGFTSGIVSRYQTEKVLISYSKDGRKYYIGTASEDGEIKKAAVKYGRILNEIEPGAEISYVGAKEAEAIAVKAKVTEERIKQLKSEISRLIKDVK